MIAKSDESRRNLISSKVSQIIKCDVKFTSNTPIHEMFIIAANKDPQGCQDLYIRSGNNEKILSKYLFNLIGKRPLKTKPLPNDSFCKAFFITTACKLSWIKFKTPDKSPIKYYFGGKCDQRIIHYHFVILTNHNTTGKLLESCNSDIISVSPVVTTIEKCEKYIRSQLIDEPQTGGNCPENIKTMKLNSGITQRSTSYPRGNYNVNIVDNINDLYPDIDIFKIFIDDNNIITSDKKYDKEPGILIISNHKINKNEFLIIFENQIGYSEFIWSFSFLLS